ncbi:MAG: universal stress protein [Alphaproteobacteria bacterium]|nr:universal stress protein [Alphaproteobacteria bacterium]
MALTNILVHIDNGRAVAARLDVALQLAGRHNAHLTALYAIAAPRVPEHVRTMIPESVLQLQARQAADAANKAHATFDSACRAAGLGARSEWRQTAGEPLEQLALHARYADMAIVGQADPDEGDGERVDLPGMLALAVGRPVLAVPYVGKYPRVGDNVMICWNASREATRAVNDALPILERAKSVTVMTVNPQGGTGGHGEQPGADISLHLARHGVKVASTHIVSNELDPADLILSRAADLSVDLLVMGVYGRSRLREIVFGGVSRHMLRHMTVPVLLSH